MKRRAQARLRSEDALMVIAWRLPRKLVAWVLIRAWAHASSGPWSHDHAPSLTMEQVVQRWARPHDDAPTRPGWLRRLLDPQRATLAQHQQANLEHALEKLNAMLEPAAGFSLEELEDLAAQAVTPTRRPVSPIQVAQYLRMRLIAGASLEQAVYEVRDPANTYLTDPMPAELREAHL